MPQNYDQNRPRRDLPCKSTRCLKFHLLDKSLISSQYNPNHRTLNISTYIAYDVDFDFSTLAFTCLSDFKPAVVAQCVRALVPQAEGWVLESQPRQIYVIKTASDNSTVKRLTIGVIVTGHRRWSLYTDAPCHSGCNTLKNPHCSMAPWSWVPSMESRIWRLEKVGLE